MKNFFFNASVRKLFLTVWLLATASVVAYAFWHNELVYNLPTPIPANYNPPQKGDKLDLFNRLNISGNKPVFLHFFNPDCPCSRFNIAHFQGLVKASGSSIDFAIVALVNNTAHYTESDIQQKFNLQIPVYFDSSLAKKCGVISTPQAVLLDKDQTLYYRGNYNVTRYCTDKRTEFAKMAIDSLLAKQPRPAFNQFALTSYGCSLPSCKK